MATTKSKSNSKRVTMAVTRGGKPIDRDNMSGGAAVVRTDSPARTPDRADDVTKLPISQGSPPKITGHTQAGSVTLVEQREAWRTPSGRDPINIPPLAAPPLLANDLADATGPEPAEFPLAAPRRK